MKKSDLKVVYYIILIEIFNEFKTRLIEVYIKNKR